MQYTDLWNSKYLAANYIRFLKLNNIFLCFLCSAAGC